MLLLTAGKGLVNGWWQYDFSQPCHSEERSDEESPLYVWAEQRGFLLADSSE